MIVEGIPTIFSSPWWYSSRTFNICCLPRLLGPSTQGQITLDAKWHTSGLWKASMVNVGSGGKMRETWVLGSPFIRTSRARLTFCAKSFAVWGLLFPSMPLSVPLWIQDSLHRSLCPMRIKTSFQSSLKSTLGVRLIREIRCSAWSSRSSDKAKLSATLKPGFASLPDDPLDTPKPLQNTIKWYGWLHILGLSTHQLALDWIHVWYWE